MELTIPALFKYPLVRGSKDAAGYDLTAVHDAVIPPHQTANVDVGLACQIPKGFFGLIASRSGLAFNHRIYAFNGVIDSDYRGTLSVQLENRGDVPFEIEKGSRIAQLIILPCATATFVLVDDNADFYNTERGTLGFGSSSSSPRQLPESLTASKKPKMP